MEQEKSSSGIREHTDPSRGKPKRKCSSWLEHNSTRGSSVFCCSEKNCAGNSRSSDRNGWERKPGYSSKNGITMPPMQISPCKTDQSSLENGLEKPDRSFRGESVCFQLLKSNFRRKLQLWYNPTN